MKQDEQIKESLSIEQLNKFILDYINETVSELCSNKHFSGRSLPLKYSTIKLKCDKKENDIVIKVTADKDKTGVLRYMSINIVKI